MNKYHARKTWKLGRLFDSKYEASIYPNLLAAEQAGEIHDLQCQVKFPFVINGKRLKHYYKTDYTYYDKAGVFHVLDAKGYRNRLYKFKKEVFEALYPYKIEEV